MCPHTIPFFKGLGFGVSSANNSKFLTAYDTGNPDAVRMTSRLLRCLARWENNVYGESVAVATTAKIGDGPDVEIKFSSTPTLQSCNDITNGGGFHSTGCEVPYHTGERYSGNR